MNKTRFKIQTFIKFYSTYKTFKSNIKPSKTINHSAQQVLLNKQQIWCGGSYLDCYRVEFNAHLDTV